MSELLFFSEECDIPSFFNEERVKQWLQAVADDYSFQLGTISFIFCNDDYILDVNRKYLNHDYYTDVTTPREKYCQVMFLSVLIQFNPML